MFKNRKNVLETAIVRNRGVLSLSDFLEVKKVYLWTNYWSVHVCETEIYHHGNENAEISKLKKEARSPRRTTYCTTFFISVELLQRGGRIDKQWEESHNLVI